MSIDHRRRVTRILGAAAGGLVATTFLPVTVAFADTYVDVPDPATFNPTQATEGFPPFYNVETGTEHWTINDVSNGSSAFDQLSGIDTQTTLGFFTTDDFLVTFNDGAAGAPPDGSQVDYANFGLGFANEWIEAPAATAGGAPTITDLFITPFGDFPL
ncbi:MAG: hypothetical protein ACRDTN_15230 [Mycobacterium sp.]